MLKKIKNQTRKIKFEFEQISKSFSEMKKHHHLYESLNYLRQLL